MSKFTYTMSLFLIWQFNFVPPVISHYIVKQTVAR